MSDRANSLIGLARQHGWTRGVELGVWEGETTLALLVACPALHMTAVDLWKPYGGPKDKTTGVVDARTKDMNAAKWKFRDAAYPFLIEKRVRVLQMDTVAAASYVEDRSVDFVFIDADHQTMAVVSDIIAWRQKIKIDGALLGHDANWPAVEAAYRATCNNITILPGNVWLSWQRG